MAIGARFEPCPIASATVKVSSAVPISSEASLETIDGSLSTIFFVGNLLSRLWIFCVGDLLLLGGMYADGTQRAGVFCQYACLDDGWMRSFLGETGELSVVGLV